MRKSSNNLAGLWRLREQAPRDAPDHGRETASQDAAPGAGTRDTPLSAEDIVLFRRAMKSVTPIRATGRVVLPPSPAAPRALLRQRRQWAAGRDAPPLATVSDQFRPAGPEHDSTRFVQAGRGPDLIRDLKRGKWPIQASLDLHGCTLDEARTRLEQFLQSCLAHHVRCIQIVHGKGLGSKNGAPVLKDSVRRWLTQFAHVLAYIECAEQNGGSGAVQVLLRLPRRTSS